mmetsp:Transcript_38868/g.78389  ORF Transcript_38868/g.78389 Transcript_38868/m.78389 type:complete len:174 (-) Transcript_38868:1387-1908(-)
MWCSLLNRTLRVLGSAAAAATTNPEKEGIVRCFSGLRVFLLPMATAAVAAAAAAAPMQMPFPPAVFAATPLPQPMLLQHRVDGCGGEGGSAGAGVSTQLPPSGHYLPQKRPAPGEEQQSSYSGLATGPSGPPQIGLAAVPFGVQMLTPHQHAMMQQLQLQQSQQQQQQQQQRR